jgi:carboxypeptidase Taq
MNDDYGKLTSSLRKISVLGSVNGILGWDHQVYMPKGASDLRAEQEAMIASMTHEMFIKDSMGKLLKKLSKSKLNPGQRIVVGETLDDWERARSVPTSLVHKYEETTSKAFVIWEKARSRNDYKSFSPILKDIVGLNIKIAELEYPGMNPYEAMLKGYDRDLPLKQISSLLSEVRSGIKPILAKAKKQDTSCLMAKIPPATQMEYNNSISMQMGLDPERSRLDLSTHPFTTGTMMDTRITTRFDHGWWGAISATIHESGHALYELGLNKEDFGNPLSSAVSLSIHESQSRIWENHIGKGMPFWKHNFPKLKKAYAPHLEKLTFDRFYRAINTVEPSLIRVEADELTYPMHIILRFELEQDIISGKVKVDEIPQVWRQKMKDLLGMDVPDDKSGCLQDVHWCGGSIGYFPTYLVGSMVAAQLYSAANRQIPGLESQLEQGKSDEFLKWLRTNIHMHGRRYKTEDLIKRATGKAVGSQDYIDYLAKKFTNIG